MAKPRMYGMFAAYTPNAKADLRYRKKRNQPGKKKPGDCCMKSSQIYEPKKG